MKDRKIGEIFKHPSYRKALLVERERGYNECYGCVFDGKDKCGNDAYRVHSGECSHKKRADGDGVIFTMTRVSIEEMEYQETLQHKPKKIKEMISTDKTGKTMLQYEVTGAIRRIPVEKHGVTKGGKEWVLGGLLLEVYDDNSQGSTQLYIVTFDTEKIELINTIGVGKHVKVRFHIETKEYYDSFKVSVILDDISGMTENEDYMYGKKIVGDGKCL